MDTCRICKSNAMESLLDLGLQPICNRFLVNQGADEYKHPLIVGICNDCGTLQLGQMAPAKELLPPFEWTTYNEPEEHLDDLTDQICELTGLKKTSKVCGVSYKDDSMLRRLKKRGFENMWTIDPEKDLNIKEPGAGVETIEDRLTPELAEKIVENYGTSDVVIARHILEHAHEPIRFMKALAILSGEEGYIVFEVPDCSTALEKNDITTIWEEHSIYFTDTTFKHCFSINGFVLKYFELYPYPFESSLVCIVQAAGSGQNYPSSSGLAHEKKRAFNYASNVMSNREKIRAILSNYKTRVGKIAMLGAGHLACKFINLMGLEEFIEFLVDDNPNKQGLFMPGSRLPIYSSSALLENDIKLCLLGLNPLSDDKVISKNQEFIDRGGEFLSIFPSSRYALEI